jgi:hypothetical protein
MCSLMFITKLQKLAFLAYRVKGLPGSKQQLKFNQDFSGTFKDGWVVTSNIFDKTHGAMFSTEAIKGACFQTYLLKSTSLLLKK